MGIVRGGVSGSGSGSSGKPAKLPDHAETLIYASETKYLRLYWHDYTSSSKCRVIPINRIREALQSGGKPFTASITKASLGLLPIDVTVPGTTGTGAYALLPDWASLKSGPAPGHISCFGTFLEGEEEEEDGLEEARLCPRSILNRAVRRAADTAGLEFLVGFEVEFTVLERTSDSAASKYKMLRNDGHAWSTARALASWGAEGSFGTVADEILTSLEDAGVGVLQFHAEGAPGQFEIVLPPLAPLAACDTLLHTRQVVESTAARHGFRVTLHPRPYSDAIGTGSHAHVSIVSRDGDDPAVYEQFYGGILEHFRAVFAFTNSHPTSYERMVDGLWAGGRWITWGTQNKETPLRKVKDSHWEVKVLDGIANPYLAMAALILAGTAGATKFTWGDCKIDPAKLSTEQRSALGIQWRFPANLQEALDALKEDDLLVKLIGEDVVKQYVTIKKAEMALLEPMPAEKLREWVIERY